MYGVAYTYWRSSYTAMQVVEEGPNSNAPTGRAASDRCVAGCGALGRQELSGLDHGRKGEGQRGQTVALQSELLVQHTAIESVAELECFRVRAIEWRWRVDDYAVTNTNVRMETDAGRDIVRRRNLLGCCAKCAACVVLRCFCCCCCCRCRRCYFRCRCRCRRRRCRRRRRCFVVVVVLWLFVCCWCCRCGWYA